MNDWGERYVLKDPPYYVRVFAQQPPPSPPDVPDRTWTGPYSLDIQRHTCDSPLDSCPITAGGSSLPLTWPGEQPLNALDESWWDFYTNTGEKNDFPLLHFEIDGQFLTNYSFQIAESTPPFTILFDSGDTNPGNDFPFGPVIQNGVLHAQVSGLAGNGTFEGRKYFFKVKRTAILDTSGNPCLTTFPPCVEQTAGQRTIETSWCTNLTYFYPHHLIALDNEDTQVGVLNKDDEIYFLVDTEAYPTTERTAAFALFGDDVDDVGTRIPWTRSGSPATSRTSRPTWSSGTTSPTSKRTSSPGKRRCATTTPTASPRRGSARCTAERRR